MAYNLYNIRKTQEMAISCKYTPGSLNPHTFTFSHINSLRNTREDLGTPKKKITKTTKVKVKKSDNIMFGRLYQV
jgi:hypothetical protein